MPIQLPDDSIGSLPEEAEDIFEKAGKEVAADKKEAEKTRASNLHVKWANELEACYSALSAPNGVRIKLRNPKEALALRMQFYRMRREMRKGLEGSYVAIFDPLVFAAEGSVLEIRIGAGRGKAGFDLEPIDD